MTEKLTICACRWRNYSSSDQVKELVEQAKADGREVEVIDDLCSLIQDGDDATVSRLSGVTIAACHERAVKSLLAWRGIEAKEFINIRGKRTTQIPDSSPLTPQADAWFPVIDKDRCT